MRRKRLGRLMVDFEPISIDFGQGLDSKTDSKMVVNGKLTDIENAVFTQAKQLVKTNGYQPISNAIIQGGTTGSPVMAKAYQNELVMADGVSLYSLSESLDAWSQKGNYTSVKVTDTVVSSAVATQFAQSSAVLGNFMLSVYSVVDVNSVNEVYATVTDLTTNTRILSDVAIGFGTITACAAVGKAVVLGNLNLAVVFTDGTGSFSVKIRILNIAGSNASFGSPSTLVTDCAQVLGYPQFDVAPTSTGASLVYNNLVGSTHTSVIVKSLNTSGAITGTATVTGTFSTTCLVVVTDSSDQSWLYIATTGGFRYDVYSSTLSHVGGNTIPVVPQQVTAYPTLTTQQTVYVTAAPSISGNNSFNLKNYTVTSAGVVTAGTLSLPGVDIATKPFQWNGFTYLGVMYLSAQQGTVFFVDVGSSRQNYIVGKCLPNRIPFSSAPFGGYAGLPPGYLCPVNIYETRAIILLPEVLQNVTAQDLPFQLTCSTAVEVDFENQDTYQALEAASVLVLNGGVPQVYDGSTVSELGFLIFPEIIGTPTSVPTGGGLENGKTYLYGLTYAWTDEQGNAYESSPFTFTITTTGSSGASAIVTFVIRTLNLTQKTFPNSVQTNVYRSIAGGSDLVLLSQPSEIENILGTEGRSFSDSVADARLSGDNQLYTNGGILANDPPPPSVIMTRHNNRVWLLDSENENTLWPSNQVSPISGLSFSVDLSVNVDTRGGPITAIAEMDSSLVGFKGPYPFVIGGDAGNTAGTGSTLSSAQFIPSDAGCNSSTSVITFPGGTIFKSNKGIYLLDRSLGVQYIGAPVQEYNLLFITAATQVDGLTQIRFLTEAGPTLIYDYFMGQWSTLPGVVGLSADIWQGGYVYVAIPPAGATTINLEEPGYYLDATAASFPLSGVTAWIKFAAIQGMQRAKEIRILGTYANGASALHGIAVTIQYDFGNGLTPSRGPFTYYFGAAGGLGTFQCKLTLPIQKCEAFQISFTEVTTGDSSETMTVSDMSMIAGIKTGLYKMPAASTMR